MEVAETLHGTSAVHSAFQFWEPKDPQLFIQQSWINKDQQGRSLVYSIKISYTKTSDKKVSVTIGNRFAFVKEDASGLIIPDLKTAGELNEKTIYLSCDEWYGVIQKMISQKIMFENAVFPGMMTKALKAYDQKFG